MVTDPLQDQGSACRGVGRRYPAVPPGGTRLLGFRIMQRFSECGVNRRASPKDAFSRALRALGKEQTTFISKGDDYYQVTNW